MATFSSGSFTTSTPIHKQHDSGFYEISPQYRNLSPTSAEENLESSNLLLRKNLFGKRGISENKPDHQFSHKHKLLLSRCSPFPRRDPSSNKETPRTSRSCAGSDKPVYSAKTETVRHPLQWSLDSSSPPLKQLCDNDSGFCNETPERSSSSKSECYGIPLMPLIENLHQRKENSKEESLAYFKHFLNLSEAKNCADLSTSEMLDLYYIYRFQRTGLKPTAADVDFYEKHLQMKEMNGKSGTILLSWKDKLERISADLDRPPKIDFLSQLHKINAPLVVSKIFLHLSGYDLQNASCVSRLWRKLVLEDIGASRTRWAYLIEKQKLRKEMEEKRANPFRRPPNFRILGNIENVQREQLKMEKTIKEINFHAFIEVGKSDEKHKPMKCPSCANLSLQNKQVITKYNCLFCGYEFCCNCLKPYTNWHFCASTYLPAEKPPANGKKYLRRL